MSSIKFGDRHIQILKRLTVGPATVQQLCFGELSSLSVRGWLTHLIQAGLVRAECDRHYITDDGRQHLQGLAGVALQRRVCNTSSSGTYTGSELGYRGRV